MTSHLHLLHTRRTEGQSMCKLHHQRRQFNNSVWSFSCFFPIRAAVARCWLCLSLCTYEPFSQSLSRLFSSSVQISCLLKATTSVHLPPFSFFRQALKASGSVSHYVIHSSTFAQTETKEKDCVSTHRGERLWNIAHWDSSSLMSSIKECVARQLFPQNCMYLWLSTGCWLLRFQFLLCFLEFRTTTAAAALLETLRRGP